MFHLESQPFTLPPPPKTKRFSAAMLIMLVLVGVVAGGLAGFLVSYATLNGRLSAVESQLGYSGSNSTAYPNAVFLLGDNVSLSNLYSQVKSSVVVIQDLSPQYGMFGGLVGYALQQGSGFIITVDNRQVIVTNNHVVDGTINQTVTFADGSSYNAQVVGSDAKADLAVLTVTPMPSGFASLSLASAENLQVGQPVVAVGSPYGLSGTLTTGIVSALGRTITEDSSSQSSGQTIADIIQTSTAINPGNSGGPLITYSGEVVGITTAGISNSQGLGFAIPSDTIMREVSSLVSSGSYNQHPSIAAVGTDMNLQIAQAMGVTTTYGYLVESVQTQNGLVGGNRQASILGSKVIIGGDIITAINGVRVANTDDLLSYLEQHTLPGQTANFTVIRNGQTQTVAVTISAA